MPNTPQHFVDDYLLYLMASASEHASAQFHAIVRANGLKVPEWRVLACLYDCDGMMVTDLAERALMEQSRMTKVVDQMVKRELVRRKTDSKDKRKVRVHLTRTGETVARNLVDEANRHEKELMSDLADTDAARIKAVLKALLNRLSQKS